MIQNGADLKSIQELMGYEDAAAVQIYLSVTKNRIKEIYDRTHPARVSGGGGTGRRRPF